MVGRSLVGLALAALLVGCAPRPAFPPPRGATWTNGLGMTFVTLGPGEFRMGTTRAEADERLRRYAEQSLRAERIAPETPAHPVRLARPFLMARTEVSVADFRRFAQATGYTTDAERGDGAHAYDGVDAWPPSPDVTWRSPGFPQGDDHPVVCVSWHDARAFAEWLNRADPRRPSGWVYRLPTEAEWEFAARGAQRREWAWGDRWQGARANFADRCSGIPWAHGAIDDHHPRTAPARAYSPRGDTPDGIADLTGNVWEWCLDRFAADYYEESPRREPCNTDRGDTRVERGGSWAFTQDYCRAAFRFYAQPRAAYDNLGFRLVLAPAPRQK
ncbi:MAG: formylglycine-generating enzyme family protein [Candidatus Brocadiia bacterium]